MGSHPLARGGQTRILGRYLLCAPIAAGGMATVHLGRLIGNKGFSRTVAIKQLHAQLVHDAEFAAMFLDEAHLTARIRHPNVVAPLDVIECDGEICIVMEYVHGESLGRLMQLSTHEGIKDRIVAAVMIQVLLGLHAAHVATDDHGHPLSIVHRDVSPQNILVGEDGITRVVDFGIAKAARRIHSTDGDKLKGKLGYMAPEQLRLAPIDHRSDLFAAGVILWELLTGKELFTSQEPAAAIEQMLHFQPQPPSSVAPSITKTLDDVVLKALSVDPNDRYASARDMARAIESACSPAGTLEVSEWVNRLAASALARRAEWIADIEEMSLDELTRTHAFPNSSTRTPTSVRSFIAAPAQGQVEPPPARAVSPPPTTNGSPHPVSQSPSLVVTTSKAPFGPDLRARRGRSRVIWLGLASAGLSMIVLLLFVRFGMRHHAVSVTALSEPTSDVTRAPAADLSETHISPTVQPAPALSVTLEATDAGASGSPHEAHGTATRYTANSRATATPTHASKSSTPDCKVPYSVDAQGIKRFRLECFSHP